MLLGDPTSENVGDIQYVGVVVGAICIALFTLFSCLTIISARRSNQRDSRRRTLPSASCQEEDDNRPDVVADNAPPSYDAGTSTDGGVRGILSGGGGCVGDQHLPLSKPCWFKLSLYIRLVCKLIRNCHFINRINGRYIEKSVEEHPKQNGLGVSLSGVGDSWMGGSDSKLDLCNPMSFCMLTCHHTCYCLL